MKNSLILLAVITLMSCNPPAKETPSLSGAYNMLNQTLTDEEGIVDDVEGIQQLKIYTDNFMMYVHFDAKDSSASFGIGTYSAEPGRIIENVIYSASDSVINESGGKYDLDIEMRPDGYQQVINELDSDGKKVTLTESYQSVGKELSSPLEGAWQEIKTYTIQEGDTSVFPITQYKTYYAGHFMYGHTFKDATNKAHTGMGFGTYEMLNENRVKEIVTITTYDSSGQTFEIDVEFNGPDEFKQTITDNGGAQNVEIYKRLK